MMRQQLSSKHGTLTNIIGHIQENVLGYFSSMREVIMAVTSSAIFEAMVSGLMRLKCYSLFTTPALCEKSLTSSLSSVRPKYA